MDLFIVTAKQPTEVMILCILYVHLCVSQFPLPPGETIYFPPNPLSGSQAETLHSSLWFCKVCSGDVRWGLWIELHLSELIQDQRSDAKHLILL